MTFRVIFWLSALVLGLVVGVWVWGFGVWVWSFGLDTG